MDWKEKFDNRFMELDPDEGIFNNWGEGNSTEFTTPKEIKKFIQTEVIEKLIEEIQPDVMNENNMGETAWAKYKQLQLKAKWLKGKV